jgi:OPA family glycerol-3-phosphate transporter-like MFS transporter
LHSTVSRASIPLVEEAAAREVAASPPKRLFTWQVRIFSLLWLAYASYYLCRLNFAAAQPAILKDFPELTKATIGAIPSVYSAVYAVGQLVNGQLSVRLGARRMMSVAMVAAGLANVALSQVSSYPLMMALWGLNGWAQSAGWSLAVGTMASWTPAARRGSVIGLLSTCYMLGNVFAWLLAGAMVEKHGWRAAFAVPGLIIVPMGVLLALLLRNRPEDAGFAPVVETPRTEAKVEAEHLPAREVLRMTFGNRVLLVLAGAFFCSNAVRYAFMNWTIQYMAAFHGEELGNSVFKAVALPLIGIPGAVGAGWASDRFFGGRRAPLASIMLFTLAALCVCFGFVPRGQTLLAMTMLGVAGFLIYGPDMLMSGAATVDFSHPRAAAAATGLTMSSGALGAVFSGAGIGWVLDQTHGEWMIAFWVLAGLALIPAVLMATLWNAKPKGA